MATLNAQLLIPHLEPLPMPLRYQLEIRRRRVTHVYFLESGLASVVAPGTHPLEVGLFGREGASGYSFVLGNDDPVLSDTYMQVAGNGHRIEAARLRACIDASVSLHRVLLTSLHHYLAQTISTALANGRSKIDARLCRWLLMASDRVGSPKLSLTHEFLGLMLGVRRAGVTEALKTLDLAGLIDQKRGQITLLDRKKLEQNSNGTYLRVHMLT